MPYVMVPVPDEHVVEALRAVVRMVARSSIAEWDEPSVAELWDASDGATQLVLATVAGAVIDGRGIPQEELAGAVGLTTREVLGVVQQVNGAATAASRPPVLVSHATAEQPAQRPSRELALVSMSRPVAEAVRTADQAHGTARAARPGPG